MRPLTTGQRERIVYRVVVRGARSGSFLPAFGIGSSLDDAALGLTLNRVVKGPSNFRASRRTVIGFVVAEDEEYITIERPDGRRVRVAISDIVERNVVS